MTDKREKKMQSVRMPIISSISPDQIRTGPFRPQIHASLLSPRISSVEEVSTSVLSEELARERVWWTSQTSLSLPHSKTLPYFIRVDHYF